MRLVLWILRAATLVVLLWVLLTVVVFLYGRRDEARAVDAIVVMGAAQYDGRPSPVLRARLDHAIALYHDSTAPRLVLTGGVGAGDTVSEAEVGRRYAAGEGVPEQAILLERTGLSSQESIDAVATLMRENGMASAVLVSDPFHMLRLRLLARKYGIRSFSSPTRSSPISDGSREEWRHLAREALILPFVIFADP